MDHLARKLLWIVFGWISLWAVAAKANICQDLPLSHSEMAEYARQCPVYEVPQRPRECNAKYFPFDSGALLLQLARILHGNNQNIHFDFPRRNENRFAITLDDGPNETFMIEVLDFLKDYNIRQPSTPVFVTFFLLGERVKGAENAVRRAVQEGHEIQIHGWSQDHSWTKKPESPEAILAEVCETRKALLTALNSELNADQRLPLAKLTAVQNQLRWVRPPFGLINKKQSEILHQHGFLVSLPSIMPGQKVKDRESGYTEFKESSRMVVPRILKPAKKPGQVVVLHNGEFREELDEPTWDSPCIARTLAEVVGNLRSPNTEYEFPTLSQLYLQSTGQQEWSEEPKCPSGESDGAHQQKADGPQMTD